MTSLIARRYRISPSPATGYGRGAAEQHDEGRHRCLAGEVTNGTTFTHVRTPSGETREVRLRVTAIWRYEGVPVPALDPGHAAMLHLTGPGLPTLRPGSLLLAG